MSNQKIGILASGRGSNLQSIMDKIAEGLLPLEIAVVISDKADAFALERAEKDLNGIKGKLNDENRELILRIKKLNV